MNQRLDHDHLISPSWQLVSLVGFQKIVREFTFNNFAEAVGFIDLIAKIADFLEHHPDVHIHNNRVTLETWTHQAENNGLTEKDYALARKIDSLFILA